MPAIDVLHLRTLLTEQVQNPMFHELISQYIDYQREHKTWGNQELTVAANASSWNADAMQRVLPLAENYYVAPDMAAFALRAMEDFPDDEAILREDAPSDVGLMMFASPFRQIDLHGRQLIIHGCLWANTKIWTIIDRLDDEDDISREQQRRYGRTFVTAIGRYDVGSMVKFAYGEPMPKSMRLRNAILPPGATLKWNDLPNGTRVLHSDHAVDLTSGGSPIIEAADGFLQFLLAVWRLMQQTLAEVHYEEPDRASRKRALRVGVNKTGITVIQLRRREGHYAPTGNTLDYRTIVRGHWRRVWCGPKDKPEERFQRSVYIHDFWRGPEGAPIIIRRRINALTR